MITRVLGSFRVLLAAALLLAVIAAACSAPTQPAKPSEPAKSGDQTKATAQPAAATKEPYKIGAVYSLTGSFGGSGSVTKRSAELEIERVNLHGGIDGHPLQLIAYDDQSKAEEAALLMRKLAQQDKVPVILGPSGAAIATPTKPVISEIKVPAVATAAIAVNPKEERYQFTTVQPVEMGVDVYLDYAKKKGWTRVATIQPTDDMGERALKHLKEAVPAMGMQIVADERFGMKDTDVTPQLSKIKAANPQIVISWATGDPAVLLYKNARQVGLDVPYFPSAAGSSQNFFKLIGETPKPGLLFCMGTKMQTLELLPDSDPIKAVGLEFAKMYQDKFGGRPETAEAFSRDSAALAIQALGAVGPDREKIRDYLETAKLNGTAANYQMSPSDHIGIDRSSLFVVEARDGRWQKAN